MTEIDSDDARLTDQLASKVMGWRVGPDRFILDGRRWLPKWRFAPLSCLDDAFKLLDRSGSTFKLQRISGMGFVVEVQVGDRVGRGSGEQKARVITFAVALALGLELPR
jgi:hypothetical protein